MMKRCLARMTMKETTRQGDKWAESIVRPGRMAAAMIAVISLLGCGPSPKSMFNEMKKAACAADVPGFFDHIDKIRMQGSIQKNTAPDRAAGDSAVSFRQIDAAQRGREIFAEWVGDIKKGESGELCRMEFVTSTETGIYASLRWKTAAGKNKRFELEKSGDRWMVVGMD